jgi:hypothetical protein
MENNNNKNNGSKTPDSNQPPIKMNDTTNKANPYGDGANTDSQKNGKNNPNVVKTTENGKLSEKQNPPTDNEGNDNTDEVEENDHTHTSNPDSTHDNVNV